MARARLSRLAVATVIVPLAILTPTVVGGGLAGAVADPLPLCGTTATSGAPPAIKHVVVVMLENLSYHQVIGSPNAPYQNQLASQCGSATSYFGATHSSAANYLAVSGGQYPPSSPPGCGSASACATAQDNLYHQLGSSGMTWGGFIESMPAPCYPKSSGQNTTRHALYGPGHNPPIFYTNISSAECKANDVGVPDLTAQSGPFWDALQNGLPSFSWVTPNTANDNEGPGTAAQNEQVADTWLQRFIGTVQQSNSYQAGNTLLLVTYDEGSGSDKATGEDCTNKNLDLPVTNGISAHQDSCHVPLFVVDPYTQAGASDNTFFDHYSITKTVEDIFGLPYLPHAADAQTTSFVGHFGIPAPGSGAPTPTVAITQPGTGSIVSGITAVTGTASDSSSNPQVQVSVDGGSTQTVSGTNWSANIDTTALPDGPHTITAQLVDANGTPETSDSVTVVVQNVITTSACPAAPIGMTELSGNVSVESAQTGWTGVYNSKSLVSRVQPAGGSYDGSWAIDVAPKAGTSGAAGVNNAKPLWVPGPPGTSTTAGQAYTASAFVNASTAGKKISLLVREFTPAGALVGSHKTTVTVSDTAWHQIASSYTAAQSGDFLRYSLFASNFASSSQYFLADCLSLQTRTLP